MKLTWIENSLEKPVEDQLKQIKLNGQSIIPWAKSLVTGLPVDFIDNSTANISTNSLNYTTIPNFSFSFNPASGLVDIMVKLTLVASNNASIGVFLDNQIVDESFTSINAVHNHTICFKKTVTGGQNHVLDIRWRMLNPGTLTKYFTGNNKTQVANLIF